MTSEKSPLHRQQMLSNFGLDSNCLETMTVSPSFIKDKESGCCEQSTSNDWDVKVEFDLNESVQFLKIDKCVYGDGHGKRCDCVVYNEDKSYFVEIKELEDFGSHDKRKGKRKDAKKQLIATINDFKTMGTMDLTKVTAVITLIPSLTERVPILIQTKDQEVIDDFLTKCGCPNIYEGNHIVFR